MGKKIYHLTIIQLKTSFFWGGDLHILSDLDCITVFTFLSMFLYLLFLVFCTGNFSDIVYKWNKKQHHFLPCIWKSMKNRRKKSYVYHLNLCLLHKCTFNQSDFQIYLIFIVCKIVKYIENQTKEQLWFRDAVFWLHKPPQALLLDWFMEQKCTSEKLSFRDWSLKAIGHVTAGPFTGILAYSAPNANSSSAILLIMSWQ